MISILTPTLDRPEFLARCIRSVLAQSLTDWEMIVYDVGDTPVIIPDDRRIRYFRGVRGGPAADFQAALDLARGEIIHPLADDDQIAPQSLEVVANAIGDSEWLVATTAICSEDGSHQDYRGGCQHHVDQTRRGSYMLGGAIYWRRSLTDRLGGFKTEFTGAADFDLYLRFLKEADPVVIEDVLYLYTDHPLTDTRLNATRQAEAGLRILEAHFA